MGLREKMRRLREKIDKVLRPVQRVHAEARLRAVMIRQDIDSRVLPLFGKNKRRERSWFDLTVPVEDIKYDPLFSPAPRFRSYRRRRKKRVRGGKRGRKVS